MESDSDFYWKRGQAPRLTVPDGKRTPLKVENRVPIWPMDYDGKKADNATIARPTFEGNSSGSSEAPGEPVLAVEERDAGPEPEVQDEDSCRHPKTSAFDSNSATISLFIRRGLRSHGRASTNMVSE